MEAFQWVLAALGALAALFVAGSIIWAVIDVLRQTALNQTTRAVWLFLLFTVPLLGVFAWLYWRPKITSSDPRIQNTLKL
ncbi:PLDc N-terminal domain-containing protein [Paenarthrobacter sp. NyZ202]|uniref:PLDc N-terminal domain-containing protein n=1 Tax=Paenarthrobacter sp. NyZ202 TaxID=3402689 RepID=UPI003CF95904